jgi:hypothetical protein
MRWLALVLLVSCGGHRGPCAPETLSAQAAAIAAECKLRKQTECANYDVIDECPLAQECDGRIDRVGVNCHD